MDSSMHLFSRVAWAVALAAVLAIPSALRADTEVRSPLAPTSSQALSAAKRLWSAIRSHDRARIAAAVDARVHTRAALVGTAGKNDHETDVERARFAEKMTTIDLGSERAEGWHAIEAPFALGPGIAWIGAEVESAAGVGEGHGARTASLTFGVRLVGGRALVIAFDAIYGESRLIFSR
jgi:hypothetical protein